MKLSFPHIQRILPSRIWHQIFTLLALLVIIPLVILGALLTQTSQKALRASILHNHKKIAIHATGEVRESIKSAQQALHVTASILGTLHADHWRQETSIVELALQYPVFQRISYIGLDGQETVSSNLGEALRNQSRHPAFLEAKLGRDHISEVQIAANSIPFLTMAVPVQQLGKTKGVLMAEFNLRGIWDLIDSIQFGNTGKAYLIANQDTIIAHPDKKLVLKNAAPVHSHIIEEALPNRAESREDTDETGTAWIFSYAPIEELNWNLVISQTKKEAYASSNTMKAQSSMIILLSIAAAILISLLLSRLISKPIHELIQGTKRIARGDFTHSFRIRRRDEIGRLLFAFNRMTARLYKAKQIENLSVVGRAATKIVHELKNSLSLVNTFIHLLPKRHKERKFINDFCNTVSKELSSWKTMLHSMTDLAKLQELPMDTVNINDVLEDVISLARLQIRQKGVHLNVHMNEGLHGGHSRWVLDLAAWPPGLNRGRDPEQGHRPIDGGTDPASWTVPWRPCPRIHSGPEALRSLFRESGPVPGDR